MLNRIKAARVPSELRRFDMISLLALLLVVFLPISFADLFYRDCSTSNSLLNVTLGNCSRSPCPVYLGQNPNITIRFQAARHVRMATVQITEMFLDIIPNNVVPAETNACASLSPSCPLRRKHVYEFTQRVPRGMGSGSVFWKLKNGAYNFVCVELLLAVFPPSMGAPSSSRLPRK